MRLSSRRSLKVVAISAVIAFTSADPSGGSAACRLRVSTSAAVSWSRSTFHFWLRLWSICLPIPRGVRMLKVSVGEALQSKPSVRPFSLSAAIPRPANPRGDPNMRRGRDSSSSVHAFENRPGALSTRQFRSCQVAGPNAPTIDKIEAIGLQRSGWLQMMMIIRSHRFL